MLLSCLGHHLLALSAPLWVGDLYLSDSIGRKNMYYIGNVFVGVFGFIYFVLLDTKVPSLIFIAIALSLLPARPAMARRWR